MTELEELKQQVSYILKRINELETQGDETDNRWKPKVGEEYWWIDVNGELYKDKWGNDEFDNNIFNHTDIFPTEEQAIFDRERKRIRRELMKYGKNFVPSHDNWAFNYNYRYRIIGYWNSKYSCHPFAIYFESEEMAKKAIKEVGEDRIKKYLFGVEG
ncbi:MAG: hypothetical protein ACYCDV_07945 [Facklamia hominis]